MNNKKNKNQMQKYSNRFVLVNDINLHYIDFGGSSNTILFLAGLGDTAYSFFEFAPKLVPHFRVLALTRRCFGKSDNSKTKCTIKILAQDIFLFLNTLGIQKVTLIGHSIAGSEISMFASMYHERLNYVIFLDAAYNRNNEVLKIINNDPVLNANNMGVAEDKYSSVDKYLGFYKKQHPNLAKIWCPTLDLLFHEGIRVNNDGSVKKISKQIYKQQIKESIHNSEINYSDIKVPILAIYPKHNTHPYHPQNADDELIREANNYYNKNWEPYTLKNINKLKKMLLIQ